MIDLRRQCPKGRTRGQTVCWHKRLTLLPLVLPQSGEKMGSGKTLLLLKLVFNTTVVNGACRNSAVTKQTNRRWPPVGACASAAAQERYVSPCMSERCPNMHKDRFLEFKTWIHDSFENTASSFPRFRQFQIVISFIVHCFIEVMTRYSRWSGVAYYKKIV